MLRRAARLGRPDARRCRLRVHRGLLQPTTTTLHPRLPLTRGIREKDHHQHQQLVTKARDCPRKRAHSDSGLTPSGRMGVRSSMTTRSNPIAGSRSANTRCTPHRTWNSSPAEGSRAPDRPDVATNRNLCLAREVLAGVLRATDDMQTRNWRFPLCVCAHGV